MIAFAAIAPHGDVDLAPELREAMEELGRRFDRAAIDTAIVVTPHNVHVEGHFGVVVSSRIGERECDRRRAEALVGFLREERLPAVGVSYGGNDAEHAEMPLDWGTEVPLDFMRAPRTVVVAPARDRPLAEHVAAGRAIARLDGRVGLIASADNGHAHDPDGPYGFHPAAAAYDARLLELLAGSPLRFEPLVDLVEDAKADSLWQLLVLQGAVGETATADVLAHAAPTYYGMLVAEVTG